MASPFVNMAIRAAVEKSKRFAWFSWGLCALAFLLTWIPNHLYTGVCDWGYRPLGFTTLLFVYVTVRIIQCTGLSKYVSTRRFGVFAWASLVVCMCIFGAGMFYKANMRGDQFDYLVLSRVFSFGAPSQWVIAIFIVAYFSKISVSPTIARISTFLSPSMFGIFIMHECTTYGESLYVPLQVWLQDQGWSPPIIVVVTAITTFTICLIVDLMRRLLVRVAKPVLIRVEDRIWTWDVRLNGYLH